MNKKTIIYLVISFLFLLFAMRKPIYSFLVYSETTVQAGCVNDFCVDENRNIVYDRLAQMSEFDVGYNDGTSVKIISKKLFLELEDKDIERFTVFESFGLSIKSATHIKFKGGKIFEITGEYYGPLYFDL